MERDTYIEVTGFRQDVINLLMYIVRLLQRKGSGETACQEVATKVDNIDKNITLLTGTVDNIFTYLIITLGGTVNAITPVNENGMVVYQLPLINLQVAVGRYLYLMFNGAIDTTDPVYVQDKTGQLYPIYHTDAITPITGEFIYNGTTNINVVVGSDRLVMD